MRSVLLILLLAIGAPVGAAGAPLAMSGMPSPLGLPLSTLSGVQLMEDGSAAFLGTSNGAFRRTGAGVVRIVAAGDRLADGRTVAGVGAPAVGPGGCVAVRVFVVGGGGRVLRQCGTTTDVVVATGEAAPGGGRFAALVTGVAYGEGGQIAFTSVLDDGRTGLFLDTSGDRRQVVRTSTGDDGTPAFTAIRVIGVSATGNVAFRGDLANGRDGLFQGDGTSLQQLVGVGDATPVGGTYRSVTGASMNAADEVAFRADLSGGGSAVFVVDGSRASRPVREVIREGDIVGPDALQIRNFQSSFVPSINASGAVAVRATLQEGESGAGAAIFVVGRDGVPSHIVGVREQTAVGVLVRLRDPVLADDGSVVVPASVPGGGPSLFVSRAGVLSDLARLGEPTDLDTGPERFRFSQPSVRSRAEDAVFTGSREGILIAAPGKPLERVAFVGGPTPLGGSFAGFDPPAADAAGAVAFGAEIRETKDPGRVILGLRKGKLRLVAQSDQRVKGGKLVDFFTAGLDPLTRPDVGPRGEIAFEATTQGGASPRGIFFRRGGRPRPVARAGRPAPGGGKFDSFGTPAILRGSKLAFVGEVSGGGEQRDKLFLAKGGRVRAVAVQGGGAPGRLGGRFDGFDSPDANDHLILFRARLDLGGNEGVFLAKGRRLGLLTGTGDPAPGGSTFRSFASPALGGSSAVFIGRLAGTAGALGLYRVAAREVPAADAAAPPIEAIGMVGGASPIGGTIAEFGSFSVNRRDQLAVVADLVDASAKSVLLLVEAGDAVVP
jgi:hypothetical protein